MFRLVLRSVFRCIYIYYYLKVYMCIVYRMVCIVCIVYYAYRRDFRYVLDMYHICVRRVCRLAFTCIYTFKRV